MGTNLTPNFDPLGDRARFNPAHGFSRDKRDYERHLLLSRLGEPLASAPSIISQRAMNKSASHSGTKCAACLHLQDLGRSSLVYWAHRGGAWNQCCLQALYSGKTLKREEPQRPCQPNASISCGRVRRPGGPARRLLRRRRDGSGRQLYAELGRAPYHGRAGRLRLNAA